MSAIYKILTHDEWGRARREGIFTGAPVDAADGYIHFSTGQQVSETATKHFAGCENLVLIQSAPDSLGSELKWETSRGGDLFPHLYRPLKLEEMMYVGTFNVAANGNHDLEILL